MSDKLPAPGCSLVTTVRHSAWVVFRSALPFNAMARLVQNADGWVTFPIIARNDDDRTIKPLMVRVDAVVSLSAAEYDDADDAGACERAITAAVEETPELFMCAMDESR